MSNRQFISGFSMIEVALAVGIIGVSVVAVIALLPVGLGSQRSAQEEARAMSALTMVASAAESLRPTGHGTWVFPNYFSDGTSTATVQVGQDPWNVTFFVSEGGLIIRTGDTATSRRQTLFVRVYPPQDVSRPVRVYSAIAWPVKPSDNSATAISELAGREGFVDTLVAYNLPPSF